MCAFLDEAGPFCRRTRSVTALPASCYGLLCMPNKSKHKQWLSGRVARLPSIHTLSSHYAQRHSMFHFHTQTHSWTQTLRTRAFYFSAIVLLLHLWSDASSVGEILRVIDKRKRRTRRLRDNTNFLTLRLLPEQLNMQSAPLLHDPVCSVPYRYRHPSPFPELSSTAS